jgi:hypothetical protein
MRKPTKSVRLTQELLDKVRAEATKQRVSDVELIRTAVMHYLAYLEDERLFRRVRNGRLISIPVANMNPSEVECADKVMRQFRNEDEDRHNLP